MTETYKDIEGYEGLYQVSNYGKVIGLLRNKELKADSSSGYKRVTLSKNGITTRYLIHRLVATAFIFNLNNKPHINHIDNNPSNNHTDNLEWVNHSENMTHAHKQGRLANIEASNAAVPVNYLRYEELHRERLGERFIAYYPPKQVLETYREGKKEKAAIKYVCSECNNIRIGVVGWKELRELNGVCPNCQNYVNVDEDIV